MLRQKPRKPANRPTSDRSCMISAICYMLHVILVMIHIVLVISYYIYHWEHNKILPLTVTNNDFWSVVLATSLQAFYTIYAAALLFLTQRLAISRTLIRRLKLTSIHDISGAWSGLGSALISICQQINVPTSLWATSAVAVYLACIFMLHVASSSVLELQTFNHTSPISVKTRLGWRDNLSEDASKTLRWGAITASLPLLNYLPRLDSAGLNGTIIYDIPQGNYMVPGNATVNGTRITSNCGLLPSVIYVGNDYRHGNGQVNVSFNLNNGSQDSAIMKATLPWPDQIQVLQPNDPIDDFRNREVSNNQTGVFLMISTSLGLKTSIRDQVSVNMTWNYSSPDRVVPYNIDVYFVHCSLSAMPGSVTLDLQNKSLLNTSTNMSISQSSGAWEIYQWTSFESNGWQGEIGDALGIQSDSGFPFREKSKNYTSKPSLADEHIMSLAGLNLRKQWLRYVDDGATPISNATLCVDKLEGAIAQAAAEVIWIAGRIGSSHGGFDMGKGMTVGYQEVMALRLNVNGIHLMAVGSASVIMLGLALHMTGAFDRSRGSRAVVTNSGALQLLWLGRHSALVHAAMGGVTRPTDANLRHAGLTEVCFAKTISDQEHQLSVQNSIDSLFGQIDSDLDNLFGQIDRGHDDSAD